MKKLLIFIPLYFAQVMPVKWRILLIITQICVNVIKNDYIYVTCDNIILYYCLIKFDKAKLKLNVF